MSTSERFAARHRAALAAASYDRVIVHMHRLDALANTYGYTPRLDAAEQRRVEDMLRRNEEDPEGLDPFGEDP